MARSTVPAGRYFYIGNCVSLDGDAVNDMKSTAVQISYRQFASKVQGLREWAKEHGYDRDLPLSKDWAVSYHHGRYLERPVYFLRWSGFEEVWALDGDVPHATRSNPTSTKEYVVSEAGRSFGLEWSADTNPKTPNAPRRFPRTTDTRDTIYSWMSSMTLYMTTERWTRDQAALYWRGKRIVAYHDGAQWVPSKTATNELIDAILGSPVRILVEADAPHKTKCPNPTTTLRHGRVRHATRSNPSTKEYVVSEAGRSFGLEWLGATGPESPDGFPQETDGRDTIWAWLNEINFYVPTRRKEEHGALYWRGKRIVAYHDGAQWVPVTTLTRGLTDRLTLSDMTRILVQVNAPRETRRTKRANPVAGTYGTSGRPSSGSPYFDQAARNQDFRRVLATTPSRQYVAMYLRPGEAIGDERHPDTAQAFWVVRGRARIDIEGVGAPLYLGPGGSAMVAPGQAHDVGNESTSAGLHLLTVYHPPQHPAGTVHHTRQEALQAERRTPAVRHNRANPGDPLRALVRFIQSGKSGFDPRRTTIVRNVWLVHFTDYPTAIAHHGFQRGEPELAHVSNTWFHGRPKNVPVPGYNFAYAARRDLDLVRGLYGRHAVLLRADAVRAFHLGDGETQYIFWGPSVRQVVPIYDSNTSSSFVPEVRDRDTGAVLVSHDDYGPVVHWAITNFETAPIAHAVQPLRGPYVEPTRE